MARDLPPKKKTDRWLLLRSCYLAVYGDGCSESWLWESVEATTGRANRRKVAYAYLTKVLAANHPGCQGDDAAFRSLLKTVEVPDTVWQWSLNNGEA